MYIDQGVLKFMDVKDPQYTPENGYPKKSTRTINIEPKHINNKATFSVDLLNKTVAVASMNRAALLRSMPLEDEIRDATVALTNAGISKYDYHEVMNTASEMRAFTIAQEDKILNSTPKKE